MRFHSFLSEREETDSAIEELLAGARAADARADALFVFFTGHHADESEGAVEKLWLQLDPQVVIGCSAEGVIGDEREVERAPGLALLIGEMPDVRIHPFHIPAQEWRGMFDDPQIMLERMGCGSETRALIGFGDPFTTPMNQLLPLLDNVAPQAPLIGGMASSAQRAGENILVRNDSIYRDGMVGVSLSGPIEVETVVSQGCRPLGRTLVITKAQGNVIEHLGGKPALAALHEMLDTLSEKDKTLLRNGLFLGRAISEYRERFGRGDFLIRNIIGVDQSSGAIAVADYVRTGQTVQFHVRDAQTADEDLSLLLEAQRLGPSPAGALLFSCNGRGTRLFAEPGHDITTARRVMPQTPVAGFFASGEIGPVGGKNFIHGHTASFALLRSATQEHADA